MSVNFFKKEDDLDKEFINDLKTAYMDLKSSEIFFENVKDPDLIDYAVFRLEAAKAKYSYFIRKAKEKGITCNRAYNL